MNGSFCLTIAIVGPLARADSSQTATTRSESDDLLLGVDGGQSHTRAVVGDASGAVIGCGTAGPANCTGDERSAEKLQRAVSNAVGEALERTGRKLADIRFAAACFGLSGGSTSRRAVIESVISAQRLEIVGDAEIALLGGLGGKPGIVVIAGTGSMAFGKNAAGETARAGGWGYVFGDEGGAFGIVRHALRAALRQEEGWGTETTLTGVLLKECKAQNLDELMHRFYTKELTRDRIASWAPLVDQAASEGDGVAAEILKGAVECLHELVIAVRTKLFDVEEGIPIVPIGGVFRSSFIASEFRRRLDAEENTVVVQPKFEPVMGALSRAYQLIAIDGPDSARRKATG